MPRCRNSKEKRKDRSHARAVNYSPVNPNRRVIVSDSLSVVTDQINPPTIEPLDVDLNLSVQPGNRADNPPSEDEDFVLQILAEDEF